MKTKKTNSSRKYVDGNTPSKPITFVGVFANLEVMMQGSQLQETYVVCSIWMHKSPTTKEVVFPQNLHLIRSGTIWRTQDLKMVKLLDIDKMF